MPKNELKTHFGKRQFEDRLYERFSSYGIKKANFIYWRKKTLWFTIIGTALFVKRLVDIVGSFLGLIFLSPLFLVVAICIKLEDSKGSVFFVQKRVGKWGKEFSFPKFRSMISNAEKLKDEILQQNDHSESITFKMKHDPRVTKTGYLIRKYSIDELPQLWCVLVGNMSLVGPRPAVPREVALYSLEDRRRLEVKPGLTCIWQISGRGDIPFNKQVELDEKYIQSQSFLLDLKLILLTIPAVISGRGAY
ncbi:MAG: sugar transferase [Lentisphaeria bacterium]|nr:sugar transferase [Lentisphaeria bacterium]